MKTILVLFFLVAMTPFVQAQEKEEPTPDVSFAMIEKVPVYPGCTVQDNETLKKCLSDNISKFVATEFNVKEASKGLAAGVHRVYVNFVINAQGKVVKVRSKGPSLALEDEAIRVIKKLPKMQPGEQKGKAVGVLYTLPITFAIEADKKKN